MIYYSLRLTLSTQWSSTNLSSFSELFIHSAARKRSQTAQCTRCCLPQKSPAQDQRQTGFRCRFTHVNSSHYSVGCDRINQSRATHRSTLVVVFVTCGVPIGWHHGNFWKANAAWQKGVRVDDCLSARTKVCLSCNSLTGPRATIGSSSKASWLVRCTDYSTPKSQTECWLFMLWFPLPKYKTGKCKTWEVLIEKCVPDWIGDPRSWATATAIFSGMEFFWLLVGWCRKGEGRVRSFLCFARRSIDMLIRTEILRDLHIVGEMVFVSLNYFGWTGSNQLGRFIWTVFVDEWRMSL